MTEINESALQQEFSNMLSDSGETAPAETEAPQVDMFELPLGDQTHKIPLNTELPIKHNGQVVKAPLEKVLNAFRQQAHLEDKFKELRAEREKFDGERGDYDQFKGLKDKYGAIQDWSEKNPEKWEKLWEVFQSRDQHLLGNSEDPNNALIQEVTSLKQQLGELGQWKSEFQKQQEEAQVNEDVKQVESQIEEVKKEFPFVDLEEKDLDGLTLQSRVIKNGIDSNLPDFRTAFLAFPGMTTKLLENAASQGRTETVKAVKKDHVGGVIARSDKPFGQGQEQDPRTMDEEDLADAALAELQGIMSKQSGG